MDIGMTGLLAWVKPVYRFYQLIMKKRKIIILVIIVLFLLYLWAELGVGIFFQDSWGGD